MAQQEKLTKKLDLKKSATITGRRVLAKEANYSIDKKLDSGSFIFANNSGQVIYFSLPPVNAVNGQYWHFTTINTGKMHVVGDTNAIVDSFGVVQKAINFGTGQEGEGGVLVSDGIKYYLTSTMQLNATYGFGYFNG